MYILNTATKFSSDVCSFEAAADPVRHILNLVHLIQRDHKQKLPDFNVYTRQAVEA